MGLKSISGNQDKKRFFYDIVLSLKSVAIFDGLVVDRHLPVKIELFSLDSTALKIFNTQLPLRQEKFVLLEKFLMEEMKFFERTFPRSACGWKRDGIKQARGKG